SRKMFLKNWRSRVGVGEATGVGAGVATGRCAAALPTVAKKITKRQNELLLLRMVLPLINIPSNWECGRVAPQLPQPGKTEAGESPASTSSLLADYQHYE